MNELTPNEKVISNLKAERAVVFCDVKKLDATISAGNSFISEDQLFYMKKQSSAMKEYIVSLDSRIDNLERREAYEHKMTSKEFIERSKKIVYDHIVNLYGKDYIKVSDIYVVWYARELQNDKALLSTNVSDGMYYELTHDGDKHKIYFDAYKKTSNKSHDEF